MRYTARARNIERAQDVTTAAALKRLDHLLLSNSSCIYSITMQPGQGLVSNNVLHDRSGFEEDNTHRRRLYRMR